MEKKNYDLVYQIGVRVLYSSKNIKLRTKKSGEKRLNVESR